MPRGPQVEKATADEGKKNELYVPDSMRPPHWRAKIKGESGKEVKNYHDLSPNPEVNEAIITLDFDSQFEKYGEEMGGDITYRFVNPNYKTKDEFEKMETEALINFIIDQEADKLLDQTEKYQKGLQVTLKKVANRIDLEITDGSRTKVIKSPKIKFKGKFYLKEAVELQFRPSLSPKKPWWKTTTGKITILTTLGITLLLLIIFRKKIWDWIRGKKKSRETIIL